MELKRVFTNLFLKTEFLSVQTRIILVILILFDIIFNNNTTKYLIMIFYIPLILTTVSPVIASIGYTLGIYNRYIENEIEFITKNSINFIFKILLLLYIVLNVKYKLSFDIICLSIIFVLFHYLSSDMNKLYKTHLSHEVLIVLLTILSTLFLEKIRLKGL